MAEFKGFIKIEGTYIAKLFVEPVLQNASVGSRLLEYVLIYGKL